MRTLQLITLTMLLTAFCAGSLLAIEVVVNPPYVGLNPGETAYFSAHALNEMGQVIPAEFEWQVEPENLGEVTSPGLFTAGPQYGFGQIVAVTEIEGQLYEGFAEVHVESANPPHQVVITPPQASVPAGGTIHFEAELFNQMGQTLPVEQWYWFADPPELGWMDPEGNFHAGPTPGEGSVIAECVFNGHLSISAAPITVGPAPGPWAEVIPHEVFLPPGGEAQFTAILHGPGGEPLPVDEWEWSVQPPWLGDISPEGLFQAGDQLGTGHIVAECDWEGNHYLGQASFHVGIPPEIYVLIEPPTATLPPGGTQQFEAHAFNQWGIEIPVQCWQWWVEPGELGSIGPMGMFQAGDENGTGFVKAGCTIAGQWYQGEAFVQVGWPEIFHAEVFPPEVIVPPEGQFQFEAVLFDPQGQPVPVDDWQWWLEPPDLGFVDEYGHFQAGAEFGDGFVFAGTEYQGEWYQGQAHVIVGEGPPPGAIIGQVLGGTPDDPVPLINAHVIAYPESPGLEPRDTFTGPEGFYQLEDLPPSVYLVKATAPGFLARFWPDSPNPMGATPIPVQGWTVSGIDFLLPPGAKIMGTVVDEVSGEALGGAMVVADRLGCAFERWGFSNPEGAYVLDGLKPGQYVVHAQMFGYFAEFFDNAPSFAEATILEVQPPQILEGIDFSLMPLPPEGGTILGQVSDETSGEAIAGGWVLAIPLESGLPQLAPTDPEGFYAIPNLMPGVYYVQCWAADYLGEFYDNAYSWLEADPVEVESGGETPLDFQLQPQSSGAYYISGTVLDADGEPISDANIYLMDADGNDLYHGVTQDDGLYSVSCAAGTYYVRADVAMYEVEYYNDATSLADAEAVVVGSGLDYEEVNFQLDAQTPTTVTPGTEATVAISEYHLSGASPNPFNPLTTLRYDLPAAGHVSLKVYNTRGRQVATLVNGYRDAGTHEVTFDGSGLASGIYIYQLQAGEFIAHGKMILMK